MMPRTNQALVVIDMQKGFRSSHKHSTLRAVEQAIINAVSEHRTVILVRIPGRGRIHQALMRHLVTPHKRYSRLVMVEKKRDDGSAEILAACRKRSIELRRMLVCGVNTHYCVLATVKGLKRQLPSVQIELLEGGCNCWCGVFDCRYPARSHHWRQFRKYATIIFSVHD